MKIVKFDEFIVESIHSFSKSKKSEKKENGLITRIYDNGIVELTCTIPYSDEIEEKEEVMWDCVFKSELGTLEKRMKFDTMRDRFGSLTEQILQKREKSKK
jgi:hypothetical protein